MNEYFVTATYKGAVVGLKDAIFVETGSFQMELA